MLLAALASAALEWGDLDFDREFQLSEPLTIGETTFVDGAHFRLEDVLSIPYTSYFLFDVRAKKCADPTATHDLIPVGDVDVELRPGCLLVFYVDGHQFYTPSLFSAL